MWIEHSGIFTEPDAIKSKLLDTATDGVNCTGSGGAFTIKSNFKNYRKDGSMKESLTEANSNAINVKSLVTS